MKYIKIKKIAWTATLLLAVLPLSGCLDAGLKFSARRHAANNPEQSQQPVIPDAPGMADNSNAPDDSMTAPLDAMSEEDISHFFDSIKGEITEEGSGEETLESQLTACDSVNVNDERCEEGGVVCAKLEGVINGESSTGWFEFKNACAACKNSAQKVGDNTLTVAGFKQGKCQGEAR